MASNPWVQGGIKGNHRTEATAGQGRGLLPSAMAGQRRVTFISAVPKIHDTGDMFSAAAAGRVMFPARVMLSSKKMTTVS